MYNAWQLIVPSEGGPSECEMKGGNAGQSSTLPFAASARSLEAARQLLVTIMKSMQYRIPTTEGFPKVYMIISQSLWICVFFC